MKPFLKSAGLLVSALAILALTGCASSAKVQQIGEQRYKLTEYFNEPVMGFDSYSLRSEAQTLCPNGHQYLLRKATKPAELAKDGASCAAGANCEYALEWQIKCTDQPQEKFTIFGKT